MTIRRLDADLSMKIAAGEVIERPASLAKELVENSIDAGAKNITIETEQGGKTCFTIEDDGCGIEFGELPLALERYATSKIAAIEDLENIHTLGYRGEALASAASVSRMEIRSRTESGETGGIIACEGGNITLYTEISCKKGTRIQVDDLFYNVPARRKFLKTASAELRRIIQVVNDYALIHPEISFAVFSDGKKLLDRLSVSDIDEALRLRWGQETKIYYTESDRDGIYCRLWWNPMPNSRRTTISVFINDRRIQDTTVKAAITSADAAAYGEWLVLIKMPPEEVDVNIHPAKQEVRFRHSQDIFRAVYSNAQTVLKNKYLPENKTLENTNADKEFFVEMPVGKFAERTSGRVASPSLSSYGRSFSGGSTVNSANIFSPGRLMSVNAYNPFERAKQPVENKVCEEYLFTPAEKAGKTFESEYIGQTSKGFLIFEFSDGIAIVDPHAAHERILYERIKASFKDEVAVQKLAIPAEIPQALLADVIANDETLKKIGFICADGKLAGVPMLRGHGHLAPLEMLRSALAGIKSSDRQEKIDTEVWWRIARLACKSAVKLGKHIEKEEAEQLLEQLKKCEMPFACPHGRPTMYKIDNLRLEKMFER
ncbi:MAG: DNA mismatch repair endonuclease MutL [Synergistaceae bacterium]|nr:DNA mismatch repair endonuclease MutL [Synergistaceae bacterium]